MRSILCYKLKYIQQGIDISPDWHSLYEIYSTLNKESLLEAIFASIVSCIPDNDDRNSFPGVPSVYKNKT